MQLLLLLGVLSGTIRAYGYLKGKGTKTEAGLGRSSLVFGLRTLPLRPWVDAFPTCFRQQQPKRHLRVRHVLAKDEQRRRGLRVVVVAGSQQPPGSAVDLYHVKKQSKYFRKVYSLVLMLLMSPATEMATEGELGSLIRVLQLFVLSTAWGMEIWVTFIAGFVLIRGVSRHTFGLVQSKLFPFYFYTLLACTAVNLAIFAAYHPRELLNAGETVQIAVFFTCLVLAAANASWFSQVTTNTMFKMQEIEREHGLGVEVGLSAQREAYKLLKEKDAKYRSLRQKFFKFHGLSSLCNLGCVICTGINLAYLALHLNSL
ncbi:hypothetical protein JRQ81_003228 [Phrynocephalus forsythii]|uniref:Transmembrane protein 205 n=1 Tax=Phrynocephalus forsythii TaxID=171643 RepID=A0A9Q0XK65_9SAUR|nr:hypothetical protein JRQ81_003228 [Phrynocephalus forsythii]